MLNKLRRYRWIITGKWKIKKQISAYSKQDKLKIIIGSGGTNYEGWIPTDLPHFDILKESDWKYFFNQNEIDNILAEHVLEHLSKSDVDIALHFASQYLKKGGCFRIAVPDGFHPDPAYIDYVSPTGKTGSLHGHLFLWDHLSLTEAALKAGFKTKLLEYYTKDKSLHFHPYSIDAGLIQRSKNVNYVSKEVQNYTSLVADLIKT